MSKKSSSGGGGKNVWVTGNRTDGYKVKTEGASRAASHHDKQADAIKDAKAIAEKRGSEVIVQNTHGEIRSKDSYGSESPTKDSEH